MLRDHVAKWLENALELGISEREFWQMTIGELARAMAAIKRRRRADQIERATFDFRQAQAVGHFFAATLNKKNKPPKIEDLYPELFDNDEFRAARDQRRAEAWAQQFKAFMTASDKRISEGGAKNG